VENKLPVIFIFYFVIASISMFADGIKINKIYINGAYRYSDRYIRSNLPFAGGDVLKSKKELDSKIKFLISRFKTSLKYIAVDVDIDEIEKDKVNIYIGLIENPAVFLESDNRFISFGNIPFYGVAGGFYAGSETQSIAISPMSKNNFRTIFILSNHFFINKTNGVSLGMDFQYRITPEIKVRFPVQYLYNFGEGVSGMNDFNIGSSLIFDFSYLKYLYIFGFYFNTQVNQGLWQSLYTINRNNFILKMRLSRFFEIDFKSNLAFSFGNYPDYRKIDIMGIKGIRGPVENPFGQNAFSIGIEPQLNNLINIDLSVINVELGLLGFWDSGKTFDNISQIFDNNYEMAFGGGLKLFFPSPISIAFCFEYGWNIEMNKGKFFFVVKNN